MRRQGLSTVVETVLLVLLVVVAVGFLSGFLIPFIRNNLQSAGSCLDTFDAVSLNRAYTCKSSVQTENTERFDDVLVSVKAENVNLDGIVIAVSGGGVTQSYTIKADAAPDSVSGISMYQYGALDADTLLALPKKNEGRTYRIFGFVQPETIQIVPMVKGEQCDVADRITLERCIKQ